MNKDIPYTKTRRKKVGTVLLLTISDKIFFLSITRDKEVVSLLIFHNDKMINSLGIHNNQKCVMLVAITELQNK